MNTAEIIPDRSFITPTPEALERAGLRLELAASAYHAHNEQPATGDDEHDEAAFKRVEQPYLQARRTYRAMLELVSGQSADDLERRLTA